MFTLFPALLISGNSVNVTKNGSKNKNIIIISDTQDPLWIEKLFLSSNNNTEARKFLFESILKSKPDAVFHLGDLVSLGYSSDSWQTIDNWMQQLSKLKIPLYPTLGNHELMIFSGLGEDNFKIRFPFYSKTGYMRQIGPLAFILLNSNTSNLSSSEISEQQDWYKKKLIKCELDTSIKAIIVGCHHPPFTNSKVVSPDEEVQNDFVPGFIQSKKSVLFLSGHSHSFEHFNYSGKDFMTIGGGGGLQHPLEAEEESEYNDLFQSTADKRNFHYLYCSLSEQKITISVHMLVEDFNGLETVYELEHTYPQSHFLQTRNRLPQLQKRLIDPKTFDSH
jgi:hypothetical protein